MIYPIISAILYLYVFWVAYIAVMGCYRAQLAGRLTGAVKWLAYPLVLTGIVLDVTAQYTLATLLFLDWPRWGEYLVTSRLQRYSRSPGNWRYRNAAWICDNLLDIFDPSGDHC